MRTQVATTMSLGSHSKQPPPPSRALFNLFRQNIYTIHHISLNLDERIASDSTTVTAVVLFFVQQISQQVFRPLVSPLYH